MRVFCEAACESAQGMVVESMKGKGVQGTIWAWRALVGPGCRAVGFMHRVLHASCWLRAHRAEKPEAPRSASPPTLTRELKPVQVPSLDVHGTAGAPSTPLRHHLKVP